jgi:hypothetical protein
LVKTGKATRSSCHSSYRPWPASAEAVVVLEDRVAYLKVAQQGWDEEAVKQLVEATYS